MKIALVNYRYFFSGGPERYMFNIKEILEKHGHTVIPFSIKNSHNNLTAYEKYFLNSVDDEIYFSQTKRNLKTAFKSFVRMFYSSQAKKKFAQLLEKEKPELIYILQYHNKISPSILYAAREQRIPVIHRISDFQYMCPNALFYNDTKGICEECLQGKYFSCIQYKCVHHSSVYSAIKATAKLVHDKMNITGKIDAFVVPSSFTAGKLAEYGISKEKLNHIPTFFNLKEENPEVDYQPYVLYIGRIEKQKGLMTLIKAFEKNRYALKIIGFSNDGYEMELKQYLEGKKHAIEFLGRKDFSQIVPYLKTCLCTVVPSEWYDNFPNTILESFAYKKAVIATRIGSLGELVIDKETGLLFDYASTESLIEKVDYIMKNKAEAQRMGENAYQDIITKYSPEKHYSTLINLFKSIQNNYGKE